MTHFPTLAALLIIAAFGLQAEGPARANMAPPVHEFRFGMTLQKTSEGPRIASIEKGGAADHYGLQVGDLIIAVESRYWKAMSDADLKSFAEEIHTWPISIIAVRNDEDVMSLYIQGER